jgi:hypothetical protein
MAHQRWERAGVTPGERLGPEPPGAQQSAAGNGGPCTLSGQGKVLRVGPAPLTLV